MSFEIPEDLHYLESHEWIDPSTGRVGITEFAQDELGDVVFVELPAEGDELSQENEFGVIESIKAVSDLYSPASGTVTAINEELLDQPELVNDDPFGEGWMLELDFEEGDLDSLLSADDYADQIE
jgi:glycine cleavage system H protein